VARDETRVERRTPIEPRDVARPRAHASATTRRLVAVFAILLAVFLTTLAFQLVALRRMERTLSEMKDHEVQMRLALEVEDAVRDQYGHEVQLVVGARALPDREAARRRLDELSGALSAKLDEPEAIAWMTHIRAASAELDRTFREEGAPPVGAGQPSAAALHARSYPLVAEIERDVGELFELLQGRTTAFRQELVDLQRSALASTAILLLGTPLFMALAVLYLSRSVARPLAKLGEGAAAVAAGDLDARIDLHTPDEFGALAAEFNRMTVALKQHQERLVESEKLAGIGRMAAGVAHEINNPLQVVIGYLTLHRDVPDPQLREDLAAAQREALRCREIVEGLVEQSRPADPAAPVDLRALCDEVAARLRVAVRPSPVRLRVDGAGLARGDGPRVRQVVFNLMKNAVEAAGPAGEVDVRVGEAGPEHVEVVVSDTGPGVAPEARARLFEPFFTTKEAGTGLGLAVSRAIALAHGGDIDVRNGEPGAIFTLRLPRTLEARSPS
jgi:two-component system, NtrC family, sensor kinase